MNNNTVYASCTDVWGSDRTPFISKSINGGLSWDSISIDTFNIYRAKLKIVDFIDALNGKIVLKTPFNDTAYVFKTNDGAQSWVFEDTVFLYDVKDLQITAGTAYLGGDVNEIYKLNSTVDVLNSNRYKPSISLYPNPNNGIFNFTSSLEKYQLKIFNIQGKIVFIKKINISGELKIDLGEISRGIYIARVENTSSQLVSTKKLIVE
tara:strand:- start:3070 stop:3690 length:621 start_codon:yes stop_codon:yes gene_type:complete